MHPNGAHRAATADQQTDVEQDRRAQQRPTERVPDQRDVERRRDGMTDGRLTGPATDETAPAGDPRAGDQQAGTPTGPAVAGGTERTEPVVPAQGARGGGTAWRHPDDHNGSDRRNGNADNRTDDHNGVDAARAGLLGQNHVRRLQERWTELQVGFVDDPRRAVHDADELLTETIRTLTAALTDSKKKLDGQRDRDGATTAETEELRQALRRYRSFFDRLIST